MNRIKLHCPKCDIYYDYPSDNTEFIANRPLEKNETLKTIPFEENQDVICGNCILK